ncbi:MAG: DUF1566 domain-containing protein [Aeriscardovia sp.]|nr:DUF1566 domain-containing protein [Aeriscardovia sp.]
MDIRAKFDYQGKAYEFVRSEAYLDRNYNDEPYALFFEKVREGSDMYFEVNVRKTYEVNGILIPEGYVAVYEDWDASDPIETIEAIITFENQIKSMEHKISVKTHNDGIMSVNEFKNANLCNKEVAGIVLQTETIGLILALPIWKEKWGDDDICVDVKDEDDYIGEANALTTLSGLEATKRIIAAHKDYEGMYAAKRCWEYECAGFQWYLPSLYELGMIRAYKDEINAALDELELPEAKLGDDWSWSSSEYTQYIAWLIYFSNGYFYGYYKYYSYVVRAVCAFESLRGVLSTPSQKTSLEELTDEELAAEFKKRGYEGTLTMTKTVKI